MDVIVTDPLEILGRRQFKGAIKIPSCPKIFIVPTVVNSGISAGIIFPNFLS